MQGQGDVLDRCRAAAEQAAADGVSVVDGRDGWLFFAPELRHLGAGPFWGAAAETASRATRADGRDPLPAILDVHRQLQARDIDLILVPVPPKAVVHDRDLFEADPFSGGRADRHHREFYDLLRAEGIQVLDLTDSFREWPDDSHGPPYCRQDTHWSGAACVEAARQIAKRVAPLLGAVERASFDTAWQMIDITGDLWRMKADASLPKERLAVRMVTDSTPDPASPVVLLGDSHVLVFHAGGDMHSRSAGLADQLAVELGVPVDVIGVRGSGATSARINLFRRAQRDPTYWEGKRVLVWVFAAREFTEADGWHPVPLD